METPLHRLGAYSSLMERVPSAIITTPGGMSLNLSRPSSPKKRSLWDFNFLLLLQFRDREGHLRVPRRHVEDGQQLGAWICRQRAQKKAGTLVSEKERRLNEIGFIWKNDNRNWDTMFRALTQFKQREGHFEVHVKHVEDGLKLGSWNGRQKQMKNSGTLVPERERRLNEIGYIWRDNRGKRDDMFRALTQFKQREGHLRVHRKHVEDGILLGRWIERQQDKKKAGTLVPERERQLNEIGHIWKKNTVEGNWDNIFRALTQFKQREGHSRVPSFHVEDGLNLGTWIRRQQLKQKAGTLAPEKECRFNEIGHIWKK
jgi:hypothetical protein